jgi:hypothetical protein
MAMARKGLEKGKTNVKDMYKRGSRTTRQMIRCFYRVDNEKAVKIEARND